jgi:hypothetical protein
MGTVQDPLAGRPWVSFNGRQSSAAPVRAQHRDGSWAPDITGFSLHGKESSRSLVHSAAERYSQAPSVAQLLTCGVRRVGEGCRRAGHSSSRNDQRVPSAGVTSGGVAALEERSLPALRRCPASRHSAPSPPRSPRQCPRSQRGSSSGCPVLRLIDILGYSFEISTTLKPGPATGEEHLFDRAVFPARGRRGSVARKTSYLLAAWRYGGRRLFASGSPLGRVTEAEAQVFDVVDGLVE